MSCLRLRFFQLGKKKKGNDWGKKKKDKNAGSTDATDLRGLEPLGVFHTPPTFGWIKGKRGHCTLCTKRPCLASYFLTRDPVHKIHALGSEGGGDP